MTNPEPPPPPPPPAPLPRITAEQVASKEFLIASKGFDQDDVRSFLSRLALSTRASEAELEHLRLDLERAAVARSRLDEHVSSLAVEVEELREQRRVLRDRLEVAEAVRADALDRLRSVEQAAIGARREEGSERDRTVAEQSCDLRAQLEAVQRKVTELLRSVAEAANPQK